jgi:hypothetical protein
MKTLREIHKNHKKEIIRNQFGPHYAKQICLTCDGAFVTWISQSQLQMQDEHIKEMAERHENTINIKVPFDQKDVAKKHGAKWDDVQKTWYINVEILNEPTSKQYKGLEPFIDLQIVKKWAEIYLDQWESKNERT